jgi:hypothetical protein
MRKLLVAGALALAMGVGMPPAPAAADPPKARVDPSFGPLLGPNPNVGAPSRSVTPDRRAYRRPPPWRSRPVIACDAYGRCWQTVPRSYQGYPYGNRRWSGRKHDQRDSDGFADYFDRGSPDELD